MSLVAAEVGSPHHLPGASSRRGRQESDGGRIRLCLETMDERTLTEYVQPSLCSIRNAKRLATTAPRAEYYHVIRLHVLQKNNVTHGRV